MHLNTHVLQPYEDLYVMSLLHESQLHSPCLAFAVFHTQASPFALPGVDPLGSS